MKTYIGIDNGVTGSIGIINQNITSYHHMPVRTEKSYTKSKQQITRIDWAEFESILSQYSNTMVLVERPFTGQNYKAVVSAARALESILCVLERHLVPYEYIDSREWQKALIPGVTGKDLKRASLSVGKRLFPTVEFKGFADADGLLIAEYARRKNL